MALEPVPCSNRSQGNEEHMLWNWSALSPPAARDSLWAAPKSPWATLKTQCGHQLKGVGSLSEVISSMPLPLDPPALDPSKHSAMSAMMDRVSVSTQVGPALKKEATLAWRWRSWEPGEAELFTDRHTGPLLPFFLLNLASWVSFLAIGGGRVWQIATPATSQLRLHSPNHDRCNLSTAKTKRQRNAVSSLPCCYRPFITFIIFIAVWSARLSPLPPRKCEQMTNLEPMLSRKASKHRGVIKNGMSSAHPFALSCSYFNSLPCPRIPQEGPETLSELWTGMQELI